VKTRCRIE